MSDLEFTQLVIRQARDFIEANGHKDEAAVMKHLIDAYEDMRNHADALCGMLDDEMWEADTASFAGPLSDFNEAKKIFNAVGYESDYERDEE